MTSKGRFAVSVAVAMALGLACSAGQDKGAGIGKPDSGTVTLPDGATVADLLAHFAQQYPRLQTYLPAVATAVNEVYSARGASLRHGDEVGLLPPVSGGTSGLPKEAQMVPLVHGPIDTRGVLETIKQPEDGAVAVHHLE